MGYFADFNENKETKDMCRNRAEIIEEEPLVQKLIALKKDLETGEINDFSVSRKYYEISKLETQIESTINEFMISDKIDDVEEKVDNLEKSQEKHFGKHERFHKRNPSIIELFRRSPLGMTSFLGAFLTATSLFYVKQTRDYIFSFFGLGTLSGESFVIIGFPLFLVFFVTGIVSLIESGKK